MLDDVLDTVRRLALAGFLILLLGIGIGTAASYGLMVRPALRDLEVLYADVARLENELAQCRAQPDPVEQYYRGAYDLCLAVLGTDYAEGCLEGARKAYEAGGHESSSYHWRWPLAPAPDPMSDREARQW